MKIAICDDEEESIIITKRYTEKFFEENKIKYEIKCFTCAERLLEENDTFDLYLLDIEMEYINGIQLGEIIRSKDNMTPIVYITNYIAYWRRAYSVHAFDYIEKPIRYNHIERVLNDAYMYGHIKEENEIAIEFVSTHGNIKVLPSKIIYFEYVEKSTMHVNRCTRMVTTNGEYMLREKISAVYTKLDSSVFAVPHKSFIIHFKNLKILKNNELMMIDNTVIPVSQKKLREVKDKFNSYISRSLGG